MKENVTIKILCFEWKFTPDEYKRLIHKVVEYTIVLLVTISLFLWCDDIATRQRRYKAVGGEYLVLSLPLFWALVKSMWHDFWDDKNVPDEKEMENDNTRS